MATNKTDQIKIADKETSSSDSLTQSKKASLAQKSIKYSILGVLGIILCLSGFLWYIFYGPRWGTMHYGICKVFAERYVDFPNTMKIRDVEYFGWNVRVFINHIDAAGQFNYDTVECFFGRQSMEITRVRINRRPYSNISENEPIKDPEIIRNFNKGLDAILLNPPDLLLPRSTRDLPLNELWRGEG